MTGYEITKATIEFGSPERLAIDVPTAGVSDLVWVGYSAPTGLVLAKDTDEWGCRWEYSTTVTNMGQVKGHPLAEWPALGTYAFPDAYAPGRFASMEGQLVRAAAEGPRYVRVGSGFTLFERMHYLHGFAETLEDLYLEPDRLAQLADGILRFQIGIADQVGEQFRGRIHGFCMSDDWGTQQATFISKGMFREFFKPRYAQLFAAIHRAGMHAWLHSCGRVTEFIDDLIDIGLDVIELQQPRALGIEELGRRFAGRICFQCPVDIQATLPRNVPAEIRDEAFLLFRHLATPTGGLVASDYGDGAAIGAPDEAKRSMLAAFMEANAEWAEARGGSRPAGRPRPDCDACVSEAPLSEAPRTAGASGA